MTLDEAIQHCKEQVQEQAKRGCYSCAEEHQQLAEWLKELKAYKEQDSVAISNLAMCHILNHEVKWINERMTREGVGRMNESEKERLIKKDIESIENRVRHAFNQGYEMGLKESSSEIPTSCGDAISRQAVMDYFRKWQPYMATRLWDFEQELSELPPVSSQQRTGRWERMSDLPNDVDDRFECSRCGNIVHHRSVMDLRTFSRWCGRCGSYNDYKMEVEE